MCAWLAFGDLRDESLARPWHDGDQNVVIWPEATAGSLIIGEVPVDRIAQLRAARP